MKKVEIGVEKREGEKAKNLVKKGYIPGIIYGATKSPEPIKVLSHNFIHFLHEIGEEQVIFNLKFKNKKKHQPTILKDIQYDPIKDTVIHLDFQRVSDKKPITVEVPLLLVGEPKGVKEGGVPEEVNRTVEIEALIQDIPEHIEIDISGLGIGDSIHVRDLKLSEKIKVLTHPEKTLFTVVPPRVQEEVIQPEEEKEVEVISEEKKKEEEEEKKEEEKESS